MDLVQKHLSKCERLQNSSQEIKDELCMLSLFTVFENIREGFFVRKFFSNMSYKFPVLSLGEGYIHNSWFYCSMV